MLTESAALNLQVFNNVYEVRIDLANVWVTKDSDVDMVPFDKSDGIAREVYNEDTQTWDLTALFLLFSKYETYIANSKNYKE